MEIGRVCVKLAGRDAGRICVVVEELDKGFVLIDGNVRRRKCNLSHLEPLDETLNIKKGASHAEVASEFKKLKLDVWETKPKKEKSQKPAPTRKPANVNNNVKKEEVKAEKPKTEVKKEEKTEKPKKESKPKKTTKKTS